MKSVKQKYRIKSSITSHSLYIQIKNDIAV